MEFSATIEDFNTSLWGHHFKVPQPIAEMFIEGADRRVVCTLNGKKTIQCALMGSSNGWFINVNKAIRTQLRLEIGSKVDVHLEKDRSEYGLPMPEAFEEALATDDEALVLFEALTAGKKRTLLHIVGATKNQESRIRKSLAILEHLKAQQGKIDFKQLNEDLKNSRLL